MEYDLNELTEFLETVVFKARQDSSWLVRGSQTFAWLEEASAGFGRWITMMENHSSISPLFCSSSACTTFVHIMRGIHEGTRDSNIKLRLQSFLCRAATSLADSLELTSIERKPDVIQKILTCLTRGGALGWTAKTDKSSCNVDPKVAQSLINQPDISSLLDLLSTYSTRSGGEEVHKDIAVSSVHFLKLLAVASGSTDFLYLRVSALIQQMHLSLIPPAHDHTINPDDDPQFALNLNHLLPTLIYGLVIIGPSNDEWIQELFWASLVPQSISQLLENQWVAYREKSTLLSLVHSLARVPRLCLRLKSSGLIEVVIRMMSSAKEKHRIAYSVPFSELLFSLARYKTHRKTLQVMTYELVTSFIDQGHENKAVRFTSLLTMAFLFQDDKAMKVMASNNLAAQLTRAIEEASAASDSKASIIYDQKWRLKILYCLEDLLLVASVLSNHEEEAIGLAEAGCISLLTTLLNQAKNRSSVAARVNCLRPIALTCLGLSRVDSLVQQMIGAGVDDALEQHVENDDVGVSLAARECRSNLMQRRPTLSTKSLCREDADAGEEMGSSITSAMSSGRKSDPGRVHGRVRSTISQVDPKGGVSWREHSGYSSRSSLPRGLTYSSSAPHETPSMMGSAYASGYNKGIQIQKESMQRSESQTQSLAPISEGWDQEPKPKEDRVRQRSSLQASSVQQPPWQSVTSTDVRLKHRFSGSGVGNALSRGVHQLPPI